LSRHVYTDITTPSYDVGYLPEPRGIVKSRASQLGSQLEPNDVGTLWTMRRHEYQARCALMAWAVDWELRIVVDGKTLLSERCPRGSEAFRLAEEWRGRMIRQGWRQITPQAIGDSVYL
jgi:hypothetical protein